MPHFSPRSPAPAVIADRVQFRVGHGGFHATIVRPVAARPFEPLVYVFDVGARPDVYALERAIDRFVNELVTSGLKRVAYVILSHIDEDHVNRFEYLMRAFRHKGITVGTVLLPWLRNSEKLLALSRLSWRDPAAAAVNLLQSAPQISHYVSEQGAESTTFVVGEGEPDDGGETFEGQQYAVDATNSSVIVSGSNVIRDSKLPWRMIVSHLEPPMSVLNLFDSIVKARTGLDPATQTDHAALIGSSQNRREIRRAMTAAASSAGLRHSQATITNWSSLSLFSSSTAPFHRHPIPQVPDDLEMQCEHGWLHTGDLPLHLPDVWRAFHKFWDRHLGAQKVCAVVAPHHGSLQGHNRRLYTRFRPSVAVFNLGLYSGSKRGRPRFAKLINPRTAMREVRALRTVKVRLTNNRP